MPLRSRTDDREPQTGAGPIGASPPKPLEREAQLLDPQTRALVGDAESSDLSLRNRRHRDTPAGRPVHAGVLDEVVEGAGECRRVASDSHRLGRLQIQIGVARGGLARELVEAYVLVRDCAGLFARQRE